MNIVTRWHMNVVTRWHMNVVTRWHMNVVTRWHMNVVIRWHLNIHDVNQYVSTADHKTTTFSIQHHLTQCQVVILYNS